MNAFVWGALALACGVAGLFFLRFWRTSRDRLFAILAAAFWVFALNWCVLGVLNPTFEHVHYAYVPRLLAFGLIMLGIVDKNRRS
jgi:hypothetical protein